MNVHNIMHYLIYANFSVFKPAEQRRMKRAIYPPCPCNNSVTMNTFGRTDLFLYTNGRCYAQYVNVSLKYSEAQTSCQSDGGVGNVGRLATFDSGNDYIAITSAMSNNIPGSSPNAAWIGISSENWDDPNATPCPPLLNVASFQNETGITIPTSNYIAVGGWSTWNQYNNGVHLMGRLCEFGMWLYKCSLFFV